MKPLIRVLLIPVFSVYLTGCAGAFIAGAAATANVVTDSRSSKEILDDNMIELEVTGLGNKAPFNTQARVTASSYGGDVLLIGQAVNQPIKSTLTQQVFKIDGVKSVNNQLQVRDLPTMSDISHDVWITTKVKSNLLTKKELQGVKIKVYTELGQVYLLGLVTREQADVAINIARNISGVKQVIKGFRYTTTTTQEDAVSDTPVNEEPAPISDLKVQNPTKPTASDSAQETEVIPYIEPVEVGSYQEKDES
ncbi:hemolysin [Vibrio albus]|jgi:osmotically-inducible protein OsmY|uniref:Hemolysin n=1 Tax=Vibrio albus TaxID=2200953 RepID=A0A2U3BCZ6_9VIBR|nr:BON domain-containing protein [Vibrio albus]PWI34676.1 hemolysin [Vibrio albus]